MSHYCICCPVFVCRGSSLRSDDIDALPASCLTASGLQPVDIITAQQSASVVEEPVSAEGTVTP